MANVVLAFSEMVAGHQAVPGGRRLPIILRHIRQRCCQAVIDGSLNSPPVLIHAALNNGAARGASGGHGSRVGARLLYSPGRTPSGRQRTGLNHFFE